MTKKGLQTPEVYNKMFEKDPTVWSEFRLDEEIRRIINERYDGDIKLLDMGCGNGRTINIIKDPRMDITGIDFSEEALKLASKKNPGIKFIECDMRDTPFNDNSFDVVISIGSHEHLDKISFSEPRRLIKGDGLFICVLPATEKTIGWTHVRDDFWEWKLCERDWINEIEKYNFKVIRFGEWLFVCQPI